jgi:sec-independent protein translocase protein TatA
MSIGPAEILVVLLIALLVFGPNRLPEMARQLGRGMRELRKVQHSVRHDLDDLLAEDDESGPDPSGHRETTGQITPGSETGAPPMPPPGPNDRMPGTPASDDTA